MGIKSIALAITAIIFSTSVNAGTVTGGSLLSGTDANQLETWLGVGDSDFTNIWAGTTGDTAASWHSVVDGIVQTFSIYDVTYEGSNYLLGGFRSIANSSVSGYSTDSSAFIFNLTSGVKLDNTSSIWGTPDPYSVYDDGSYFATFGGGLDLYGGNIELGSGGFVYGGYSYRDGSVCAGHGLNLVGSCNQSQLTIRGLETYTFTSVVPIPAAAWLFGSGLIGLVGVARRKRQA